MKTLLLPGMAIIVAAVLSACAVLETVDRHELGTRIAVAEYIGGDAAVAERVIEVAGQAQDRLEGDPRVEVARLRAEAERMIPWGDISPGQRILALEVLAQVEARLREDIEVGEVPAEALADLRSILSTIIRAAERERRLASV